ncbi:GGDEF domain-containing protein [Umezawaea beigongshangensis]|uniref:GGDEF domain-containing protein n=1 Tax=Umezawaea beigongshangensis TaxID=2780383 RepID=UPI0018F20858|nr:GGDEF domain-containing protein [Umezawaea beigongshangensis]
MEQVAGQIPWPDREVRALLNAGRLAEANTLFDEVVTRISPDADHVGRTAVMLYRAVTAWRLGRIPLALELAAEGSTDLDPQSSSTSSVAEAMSSMGYLLEGIGNRRAALDIIRQSVDVARRGEDPVVLAQCLQRLGGVLNFRAINSPPDVAPTIFAEARGHLEEGLTFPSILDSQRRSLLGALSRSLAGLGELERAVEVAEQTLALSVVAEDQWGISVGNWVLSVVRREQGRMFEARTLGSRSVTAAELINDTSLLLRFSLDLADVCRRMSDPVGEAEALRRSVAASRTAMDTLQEGLGQALEQRRLAVQAQRAAEAAQEAAARDPLTGLANRLGLERSASALLESTAARGRVPWLVIVDVDWFKDVNDDAGHAAGDAALREIAQLLRRECRADDLVARWAGDEFVIVLGSSGGDYDVGPTVAERIRAAVDGHDWTMVLGTVRRPTVSIGVAAGPAKLDQLFAAADMALYRAKRQGRNRVEVEPSVTGATTPLLGS